MPAHWDNQVFVLVIITHVTLNGEVTKSDPKAVVFSSRELLCLYLMDTVQAHIHHYEERFAVPLLKYKKERDIEKFVKLWRHAIQNNGRSTGFEAYWDERPLVIINDKSKRFRVRKNCEYTVDVIASSEDEALDRAAETPTDDWDSHTWSFSDAEEIKEEEQ